jgi:hypothetical protein
MFSLEESVSLAYHQFSGNALRPFASKAADAADKASTPHWIADPNGFTNYCVASDYSMAGFIKASTNRTPGLFALKLTVDVLIKVDSRHSWTAFSIADPIGDGRKGEH